jgi:zona occludens toxin (predicted ATPase)
MLRLYQSSMNGPRKGGMASKAELRGRDLAFLMPILAVMLFIALWPKALVGATTASIERAVAPAQVAADRPADQIHAVVPVNPPKYAEPLPGDPAPAAATTTTGATP